MKNLYVISGPSGVGKSTLVDHLLLQHPNVTRPVTHTTRPPRPGEINGIHYHFISEPEFSRMRAKEQLIEHTYIYGNYYGTSRRSVERLGEANENSIILILDTTGASIVRRLYPQCTTIYISAPIQDIRNRLLKRGQKETDIDQRIREITANLSRAQEFTHIVENINLEHAYDALSTIVLPNTHRIDG